MTKKLSKTGLSIDTLVYCTKFEKLKEGEHVLTDYKITEKIEEQKEKLL